MEISLERLSVKGLFSILSSSFSVLKSIFLFILNITLVVLLLYVHVSNKLVNNFIFFIAVKYTQRFLSQSYIRMSFTSNVNLPWKFSLRFRTAVPSGTLVETSFKSSVSSLLEVSSELGRKKEAGKKLVGHFDLNH